MSESNELFDAPIERPEGWQGVRLMALVQRHAWIMVAGVILGTGVGYFQHATIKPVFLSATQVLVIKKEANVAGESLTGPAVYQDYYDDYLSSHALLIRSPLIVGRAVKDKHLDKLKSFAGMGDPTGAIIAGLTATRPPDPGSSGVSKVLVLTYKGGDSRDCQTILNAILDSYEVFLTETYQNVSEVTVRLIVEAKDVLQKQISDKETEYRKFRHDAPLSYSRGIGSNIHAIRMDQIERDRTSLMLEISRTESQVQTIERSLAAGINRNAMLLMLARESPKDSAAGGLPQTETVNVERQLMELLLQEQSLLEDFGAQHPQVKSVRDRIQMVRNFRQTLEKEPEIERKGPDLLDLYITTLRTTLQEMKERLNKLDLLFTAERDEARKQGAFEVEDELFRQQIARSQRLFESVMKRLEEINLTKNYGGYNVQRIDPPAPGYQIEPSLRRVMMMAAIVGGMIGFCIAYLMEMIDKGFRNPEEIRQLLGSPVMGHIPRISAAERAQVAATVVASGSHLDHSVFTAHIPRSPLAEAYRAVRTAIYFSTRGEGHRVLQITSSQPGDGKTTLAMNLAVSMAQSGKRVLLFDADFYRARVARLMGLDNSFGLISLMKGERTLEEAIQQSEVANLFVLCPGPKPPNPADSLTHPSLQTAIDQAREAFEFVIIDTPALLTVTDASVVAPRADAVLMVINVSASTRPESIRAIDLLQSIGARVIGVVVNAVGRGGRYGYNAKYDYSYNYSYNYGENEAADRR